MAALLPLFHGDLQHVLRVVHADHIIAPARQLFCHAAGTAAQIQHQAIAYSFFLQDFLQKICPLPVGNVIHKLIIYFCKTCIGFHSFPLFSNSFRKTAPALHRRCFAGLHLVQPLYHMRREGSGCSCRHLLPKLWPAGIIPAKQGGPACRAGLHLVQPLYQKIY